MSFKGKKILVENVSGGSTIDHRTCEHRSYCGRIQEEKGTITCHPFCNDFAMNKAGEYLCAAGYKQAPEQTLNGNIYCVNRA